MRFWFVVYLVGAFLTYGYVYNDSYDLYEKTWPNLSEMAWKNSAFVDGSMAGVFWPIYWPGTIAVKLFDERILQPEGD